MFSSWRGARCRWTQTPSRCGEARMRRDPGDRRDHPDLGETTGASITDKRAATRPVSERDGTRDAVILVMPEDDNTRLGRQTAGQGGALVEDRMAVTLPHRRRRGRRWRCGDWDRARRPPARWGSGAGCMNALEARRGQGGRCPQGVQSQKGRE